MQAKLHITNLIKILSYTLPHVENFWRQWNLDHITVTKILKFSLTNRCRKWRNRFKREKFVVLAEYSEQQTDCSIYKRKNKQIKKKSFAEELVVLIFLYQTNGNHATELSTVGYVNSERHLKTIFDFTKIVNNYRLKWGTVC